MRILILVCFLSAASCGGGGGDNSNSNNNPINNPPNNAPNNPAPAPTTPVGDGPFIVVDQFGYLPNSNKIAVIRNPETGFDAADSYTPSQTFELVNANTDAVAFSAGIQQWNSGTTDTSSGDKVWWFDFSSITAAGEYFVRDSVQDVESGVFTIGTNVFREVLVQAVRTFFYQRAGFAKQEPFAAAAWTDDASHLGPLQDTNARLYNNNSAATERDLRGGWYDAGDYNKYTNWTADYILALLHAYVENPPVWTDDFNIPESGNGIADLIDEIKWGTDWLLRMQTPDGSVLSIVGLSHASPPSAATGQSFYGSASTSATLTTAAALAFAAKVFGELGDPTLNTYAQQLQAQAQSAWAWADNNPSVIFRNNDAASGTEGLGAGQQEVNDTERLLKKIIAAIYLYDLTGNNLYRDFVDNNYNQFELITSSYASDFRGHQIRALLYYSGLVNVDTGIRNNIRNAFANAMNSSNAWPSINSQQDPYRAFITDYTWGSSATKARKGSLYYELFVHGLGAQSASEKQNAALDYLHYMHGVNPLGLVYLSNMYDYGAELSVNEFYHSWFTDGSSLWDRVGDSIYGPAPGFVVGGPNPFYNWDSCCPNSCGVGNNALCGSAPPSPPVGQPDQKSYLDFNTSWPLNSWEISENHNNYQVEYIRLLSKFVQ